MVGRRKLNPVAEQALDWMLLLRSGEASDSDIERFQAWRSLDPRNDAEAARLIGAMDALSPTSDPASRKILRDMLLTMPPRRRALKSLVGFAAVAVTGGGIADRFIPLDAVMHDLRTATAERRRLQLSDGSTLTLNARSVADLDFSGSARGIRLHQGEAYVQMTRASGQPFSITTRDGTVRALGTAVSVDVGDSATGICTLDSRVDIVPASGTATRVPSGYTARFSGRGVLSARRSSPNETSWINGQIVAVNQPLGEVVERLRPYYRGWISIERDAEAIGISGVFQLDHIDQAINSLVEAGPIAVSRRAALWVSIARRNALEGSLPEHRELRRAMRLDDVQGADGANVALSHSVGVTAESGIARHGKSASDAEQLARKQAEAGRADRHHQPRAAD